MRWRDRCIAVLSRIGSLLRKLADGAPRIIRNDSSKPKPIVPMQAAPATPAAVAVDAPPGPFYIRKVDKGDRIQANKPMSRLLGYGQELLDGFAGNLIPLPIYTDDFAIVAALQERVARLKDGEFIEMAFRMHRPDGGYSWVHAKETPFSRTPAGFCRETIGDIHEVSTRVEPRDESATTPSEPRIPVGTDTALPDEPPGAAQQSALEQAMDVAETGIKQELLAESIALIAMLLQDAPAGISFVDRNFRHLHCNAMACDIYEIAAPRDIAGKTVAEGLPLHWTEMELFFRSVLDTRMPITGIEMRIPKGDSISTYDVNYYPIKMPGAEVVGVGVMMYDITGRKQIEQDLKAEKSRAEEASRTKDQFLAVLSHELRTPMTPVLLAAKAMEDENGISPFLRSKLAMIRRNVELEVRLIDDLLDLTRLAHRRLEPGNDVANLHELILHVADIYLPQVRAKGQTLSFELEAGNVSVRGDAPRLQQMLWNLVSNSVKFTPNGGSITIKTFNRDGKIVVQVNDTGVGIDAAMLPHIFDAFTQGESSTHRTYGGLGLGLAITLALTELHGGELAVESPGLGKGATFTLALPTVTEPLPAHGERRRTMRRSNERSARILLVEDHEDSAEMIAFSLRCRGWTVTTAGSVHDAIAQMSEHDFDILVSDLSLPDGSGYELLHTLRRKGFALPAVALSGYGNQSDLQRSEKAGFAFHLVKPVGGEQVEEVVLRLLLEPSDAASIQPARGYERRRFSPPAT